VGWEDLEAAADERDRELDEAEEEARLADDDEVLITPPPREPLQLPAAGETVEGEYTVDDWADEPISSDRVPV